MHILVRDDLDFNLQSVKLDVLGRYIVLEATITDSAFLSNYYAPNKCSEQCSFFKFISDELKTLAQSQYSIVLGGDFNVIFDQDLDGNRGIRKLRIQSRG